VNEYIKLSIWVVVIGTVFLYLWRKGHLLSMTQYVQETREELRKCTWPSREELKGSTMVVLTVTFMLGMYTVVVDLVISTLIGWIT